MMRQKQTKFAFYPVAAFREKPKYRTNPFIKAVAYRMLRSG
jgi:hypothetical protein